MIKLSLVFILALYMTPAFATIAFGTPVLLEDGSVKAIQDFVIGDEVAVMGNGSSMSKISLSKDKVAFSAGTGSTSTQTMIFVHFGDNQNLVVSRDQVFLTASQKFKQAVQLVPGVDQLLSQDGSAVPILSISIATYEGGVHHIASDSDENLENCYLVKGVWVGSYKHQMYWTTGLIQGAKIFDDFPLNH